MTTTQLFPLAPILLLLVLLVPLLLHKLLEKKNTTSLGERGASPQSQQRSLFLEGPEGPSHAPSPSSPPFVNEYGMYVWTRIFNASAPECNGVYPSDPNVHGGACFYHNYETQSARDHLWASCNVPERQVRRIFLEDVKRRIENNGRNVSGLCDETLRQTLLQAHSYNIQVYALFAVSDANFSEKDLAQYPSLFNLHCGDANNNNNAVYFDGVAVNNEYFTTIKTCGDTTALQQQLQVLQDLQTTADNAAPLPLHFSVSWNWDCCDCSANSYQERLLTWNGTTKTALQHMMDIADSVDVQVAWNTGSTMTSRSLRPYQYWESNKMGNTSTTAFYVWAYANPTADCRQSFAPHVKGSSTATESCAVGDRTELGMWDAFDEVESTHTFSRGGIHYHGGVYSTGMPGWPKRSM